MLRRCGFDSCPSPLSRTPTYSSPSPSHLSCLFLPSNGSRLTTSLLSVSTPAMLSRLSTFPALCHVCHDVVQPTYRYINTKQGCRRAFPLNPISCSRPLRSCLLSSFHPGPGVISPLSSNTTYPYSHINSSYSDPRPYLPMDWIYTPPLSTRLASFVCLTYCVRARRGAVCFCISCFGLPSPLRYASHMSWGGNARLCT